jgi:hypothetical protein
VEAETAYFEALPLPPKWYRFHFRITVGNIKGASLKIIQLMKEFRQK